MFLWLNYRINKSLKIFIVVVLKFLWQIVKTRLCFYVKTGLKMQTYLHIKGMGMRARAQAQRQPVRGRCSIQRLPYAGGRRRPIPPLLSYFLPAPSLSQGEEMSARQGFYRQELNKTVWEVPERYQNLTPVGSGAYGSVWWVYVCERARVCARAGRGCSGVWMLFAACGTDIFIRFHKKQQQMCPFERGSPVSAGIFLPTPLPPPARTV